MSGIDLNQRPVIMGEKHVLLFRPNKLDSTCLGFLVQEWLIVTLDINACLPTNVVCY